MGPLSYVEHYLVRLGIEYRERNSMIRGRGRTLDPIMSLFSTSDPRAKIRDSLPTERAKRVKEGIDISQLLCYTIVSEANTDRY